MTALSGWGGELHEIAIICSDHKIVPQVAEKIKLAFPHLSTETWQEIAPDLGYSSEASRQMIFIFMLIIMLALIFGITNTMLMSVLDRVREIGVVLALGMKPVRIFFMILLETVFLSIIGGLVGIVSGWGTIAILNRQGIDLSIVSEALAAYGVGNILYPILPPADYFTIAVMVVTTAVAAAVYPGLKAVRLKPVEAIRTY